MQGQQQQAYDRGITIFSPDGRLYQVEYAREAVKRGTASIGIRAADGVVLAVDKRIRSPLMERDSVEKIHKIDDHIGIASAGHVADARQLIDFARRQAQINQLRYDEPIGVETLTKTVTDHIQQYTQIGGARPFGVALIVGGINQYGEPHLFETDPSGTPYEWQALAVGSDRGDVREYLEEHYSEDIELTEAVGLALRALASVNGDLKPEGVGLATVDAESRQFVQLTDEEVEEYLVDLDLLADDDPAAHDDPEESEDEPDEPDESEE